MLILYFVSFHCCLSLSPFNIPYCSKDGFVFDVTEIFTWLQKHKTHPITGKKLSMKQLIKLKFHKNQNGQFCCPVLGTVFTNFSHIVSIRSTGNVYSYQAIKKLNFKLKNMRDLIENEPFLKSDIIHIQDPNRLQDRLISRFVNLKANKIAKSKYNETTSKIINVIHKKQKENICGKMFENPKLKKKSLLKHFLKENISKKYFSTIYTTPAVSSSFTSTIVQTTNKQEYTELTKVEIRKLKWKSIKGSGKKAYVRLNTTMGSINLLLHCDLVPQTCHSFLIHCENGFYTNTVFHRKITNLIIQGGDPIETGHGGECAWGGKLKDEINKNLNVNERGILSMSNNGLNSGGSEFFITFGNIPTINKMYTVFGKLVGGNEVLNKMEIAKTNREHRPLEDIRILEVIVFKNPFDPSLTQELINYKDPIKHKKNEKSGNLWTHSNENSTKLNSLVGKYIKM